MVKIYSIVITTILSICLEIVPHAQTKQEETRSPDQTSSPPETKAEIKPQDRDHNTVDMQWLETLDGEIVMVNPMTQRIIVRDTRNHRTKLISITPETVFKKGDSEVRLNALKLGARVLIKYDFMESNARLIYLGEEPKAPREKTEEQKASKEK